MTHVPLWFRLCVTKLALLPLWLMLAFVSPALSLSDTRAALQAATRRRPLRLSHRLLLSSHAAPWAVAEVVPALRVAASFRSAPLGAPAAPGFE